MARRSFTKPSDVQPESDKPSMEQVLDHYGVDYTHRTSQMVRCPIHGDFTTPSCSINLDKQVFNCHSCGEKGDVWTLIMRKEGIDFGRAREFAASHGWTDGDAGGSGSELRGSDDGGGSRLSAWSRSGGGDRPYVPTWRRR